MRILIAEDDVSLANSIKKNLLDEQISCEIANSGEQALEMIKHNSYDILLLDWKLPGISGLEVCRILRNDSNQIPIILLTALSEISSKIEAFNCGADDYITKPFVFSEVLARINAIYRRNSLLQISFGNMKLNIPHRKLFIKDVEIKLTEKEFELLHYFVVNKGRIISKEELCEKIWKYNFIPPTNIIESAVKNLRKKIEPYCEKSLFKNVYGEGYVLIEI
ncbi:MAG: response regulator transcription factor [Ignavibacteriaceae bacterium]|nr:response regulator transcription factor [Ignavibacteriaceae bacterium]